LPRYSFIAISSIRAMRKHRDQVAAGGRLDPFVPQAMR
jgi:hypothetical protein